MRLPTPAIVAVSSRRRLAPGARTVADERRAVDGWVDALLEARVDVIQIRETDWPAATLRAVIARAVDRARDTGTLVMVNDRADVAVAAGAAGVHLPSRGLPIDEVRRLDPKWIVGRSVHEQASYAGADGSDYWLFGTVFPSVSKPGQRAAGLDALARAARLAPCPVLAIGGVTIERAGDCRRAGAAGIAAIGLFLPAGGSLAHDVAAVVRALRQTMAIDP